MALERGVIGTYSFDETRGDFIYGWPRVKFPKGAEPMAAILEQVRKSPLPKAALRYESPGFQLLVAICRELQRTAGEQPFFLGCRTAGRLLGVDHSTASRKLQLLLHDKIIELVEKGSQRAHRSSRYRYLPPL